MNPFLPTDWMRLSFNTATMMMQAQSVIAMRMMGMAGIWSVAPSETNRMVQEKLQAGVKASIAGHAAMMAGQAPAAVAEAALQPIARTTAANLRRLSKRGPKHPF